MFGTVPEALSTATFIVGPATAAAAAPRTYYRTAYTAHSCFHGCTLLRAALLSGFLAFIAVLSCAVLPLFDMFGGPTSPLSTRTDFRSRLDRGVTIVARVTCIWRAATPASLFATFLGGLLIQRAHPLSTSYGNFSFILWQTFSPLGTLFLSVFVISVLAVFTHIHCAHLQSRSAPLVFLGGASRGSLGERTGNHLLYFLSLPLHVEGTSLTTSLRYQDTVLAASYIGVFIVIYNTEPVVR